MEEKWVILICCSIVSFNQDFFNDLPSVITRRLRGTSDSCNDGSEECLHLSNMEYNALHTAYTWASAFTAVVAALIIGKKGARVLMWTSCVAMVLGAFIFAAGSYAHTQVAYPLLLLGRITFGFGNGASVTINNQLVNQWWDNSGTVTGFYILAGRAGSGVTYALNGGALKTIGMRGCMWLGVGLSVVALIAGYFVGKIDRTDKGKPKPSEKEALWNFVKGVDSVFWSFAITYFLIHAVVSTYTNNASNLLGMLHDFSEDYASYVVGIVHYVAIIIPVVGILIDRFGKRDYWMAAGSIFAVVAFSVYYEVKNFHVWILSLLLGLGYALFDPTASSSTSIVSPHGTDGMANGVLKFFRYIAVGAVTTGAGAILDNTSEIPNQEWKGFVILLLVLSVVAVISAFLMVWFNSRSEKRPLSPTFKEMLMQTGLHNKPTEITPLRNKTG